MYADTEARLNALKEKVNRKEGSVEKMQKEIDALGGGSALEQIFFGAMTTRQMANNRT